MAHYTQCKMRNSKNQVHVAWIPSQLAKLNRHIELRLHEEWEPWIVEETWGTKESSEVEKRGHESTQGWGSVVK